VAVGVTLTVERPTLARRIAPRADAGMVRWWLLCSALTVALRLPFFDVPLGIDEGGDAFVARAWGATDGSMYGGSWLDRPPLLVLAYRIGVIGGDIGIRVLGSVAAVLLVAGTMMIAHRIGGPLAARLTGLIAAIMMSSVVLGAVFTGNELLASVPMTFSVVALVHARDASRPERHLMASGFLAGCALLVKQSFADVAMAGAVFLVVSWLTRERSGFRPAWVAHWLAGLVAPIVTALAWVAVYSVGIRRFVYAIVGFRIDSLDLLNQSQEGTTYMLVHLGLPVLVVSGVLVLLPWAGSWLLEHRGDPQLVAPLMVWLVAGFVGVAGGGQYFPHYFVQPLAALAVLSGCALAATGRRALFVATAAVLAVLAIGNVAVGATLMQVAPPQERTLAVADFLRANGRPDDRLYVMYARANLLYYADMHSSSPYAWSTMVQAMPEAERQLRDVLRSDERPTWVVTWQQPTAFGLDRSGETRQLLRRHYVQAAVICGKTVLIRKDDDSRRLVAPRARACPELDLPSELGPHANRSPADGAEYVWQ
jgi:4-amino-4-deoxy-L-arabinose transferase-like glycosyltransferase